MVRSMEDEHRPAHATVHVLCGSYWQFFIVHRGPVYGVLKEQRVEIGE